MEDGLNLMLQIKNQMNLRRNDLSKPESNGTNKS